MEKHSHGHQLSKFKKTFFLYMIDHLKFDILTKFGEKINTGSMLKLGLNLVSKNVSIFEKISI